MGAGFQSFRFVPRLLNRASPLWMPVAGGSLGTGRTGRLRLNAAVGQEIRTDLVPILNFSSAVPWLERG